jgi:hypothetical protein
MFILLIFPLKNLNFSIHYKFQINIYFKFLNRIEFYIL